MRALAVIPLLVTTAFLGACNNTGEPEPADPTPVSRSADSVDSGSSLTTSDQNNSTNEKTAEAASLAVIETMKTILSGAEAIPFLPEAAELFTNSTNPVAVLMAKANLSASDLTTTQGPIELDISGECGGNANIIYDVTTSDGEITTTPLTANVTLTLGDFCNWFVEETSELNLDGTVNLFLNLQSHTSGTFDINFDLDINSSISNFIHTGRHSYGEHCSYENELLSCSQTALYNSENGVEFSLEDITLTGNKTEGFTATYGELNSNEGYFYSVTLNSLLLCENGNLQNGELVLTDRVGEVISVTIANCNEAVITYQGNSWMIEQPTIAIGEGQ